MFFAKKSRRSKLLMVINWDILVLYILTIRSSSYEMG